jgi:hypothetical protein
MKDVRIKSNLLAVYNNNKNFIYNNADVGNTNTQLFQEEFKTLIPRLEFKSIDYTSVKENINFTEESLTTTTLVLNMSHRDLYYKDFTNIPKYAPGNPKHNISSHEGKIYIMNIYHMPNPSFFDRARILYTGLLNKYENMTGDIYSELKLVIRAVFDAANKVQGVPTKSDISLEPFGGQIGNSGYGQDRRSTPSPRRADDYLHVVTYTELKVHLFDDNSSIYVTNKGILLSIKDPLDIEEHPSANSDNPFSSAKYQDAVYNNIFNVMLVDNEDKFNDKYIFLLDRVIKIPKIRQASVPSGLYVNTKVNGMAASVYYQIEEAIDKKIIFDTEEEALNNKDQNKLIEREKQEFERFKLENMNRLVEKESRIKELEHKIKELEHNSKEKIIKHDEAKAAHSEEYEKEINRYKKEIEQLKLKNIKEQYEQERKALEEKNIYEQQRHYMDIEKRKRDDFYNYQEHRRDSAVELIKLTATVLSFAGTVYLLATKMNK